MKYTRGEIKGEEGYIKEEEHELQKRRRNKREDEQKVEKDKFEKRRQDRRVGVWPWIKERKKMIH